MVRPITVPIPPCRAAIAMSNLSETTAERIEQVRVLLHREDPSAQVRPSDEPGSIEVASILPHARVSAKRCLPSCAVKCAVKRARRGTSTR